MVQEQSQNTLNVSISKDPPINTHNHIDYGGDDTEHSDYPRSKIRTPHDIEMRRTMYSGD